MASSRGPGTARRLPGCRRAGLVTALLAMVLAAALTGCAALPASGPPHVLEDNGGLQQQFVQPLPPPGPNADWSPQQVIEGFLHASASLALDRRAARLYLAPNVKWQPSVVIVVGAVTQPEQGEMPAGVYARTGQSKPLFFQVTGPRLATLTSSGEYINQPGTTATYGFTLAQYDGVWRIQSIQQISPKSTVPRDSLLLLDQADFQQVFQPRNLYFFAQSTSADQAPYLVPDPVFAPVQGSTADLARRLVRGLISGGLNAPAASWLSGETITAFPPGTLLLGTTISSSLTAVVNLGGTASTVPRPQQQQMYEQLYETLVKGDEPAVASSVQLEFNGRPFRASRVLSAIPDVGVKGEPLYFAGTGNVVYVKPPGRAPVAVARFAESARITALAVAPAAPSGPSRIAVATAYAQGCAVSVGTPSRGSAAYRTFVLSRRGGPCASLSWDGNGDLWAAAGSRVWVAEPSQQPQPVGLPPVGTGDAPPPTVLALKVAPDGTRVALLLHTASGNGLYLAAVTDSGSFTFGRIVDPMDPIGPNGASELSNPTAVSWYTPYSLAVVDGSEVYQVPLTGGQGQPIAPVPKGTDAISANEWSIAFGTTAGTILATSAQNGADTGIGLGIQPAYGS